LNGLELESRISELKSRFEAILSRALLAIPLAIIDLGIGDSDFDQRRCEGFDRASGSSLLKDGEFLLSVLLSRGNNTKSFVSRNRKEDVAIGLRNSDIGRDQVVVDLEISAPRVVDVGCGDLIGREAVEVVFAGVEQPDGGGDGQIGVDGCDQKEKSDENDGDTAHVEVFV